MKRTRTVLLLAIVVFGFIAERGWTAEAAKIRVLITTGGHGFEAAPFFAVFDAMPDVIYSKATLPEDADLLKPGLDEKFDVIVRYDMVSAISPQQQKAFVELLNKGIGLVALHHNLVAHRNWDEYRKIIGGKLLLEPTTIDGKEFAKSPYRHDEDLTIHVVDPQHPITQGMGDFRIHDETYGLFYTSPAIHVLLSTDHPRNNPLVAWTNDYGKSRVVYLMLGHDGKAYENPQYRELVHRSIRWAAGR
jgi:type 1 glutamine amidotransferase